MHGKLKMMSGKIDQLVGRMVRPIAGLLLAAGSLFYPGLMTVHAQTVDANSVLTYAMGFDSITITDCEESASRALVIPSSLDGYPVRAIGESAFASCNDLTSVTIGSNVASIGGSAFQGCSSLTASRKRHYH